MTKLADTLANAVSLLAEQSFALVGGLAVSARTEPRFTRDIDIAIAAPDDAAAEAVMRRVLASGYQLHATVEQTKQSRLSTVRLRRDPRAPFLDLIFATCGVETEIAASAERMEVLGTSLPVAQIGHLIAMKLLSREPLRPTDDQDLVVLGQAAVRADWTLASQAVEMIVSRGFERGRDLVTDLGALQRRVRP